MFLSKNKNYLVYIKVEIKFIGLYWFFLDDCGGFIEGRGSII